MNPLPAEDYARLRAVQDEGYPRLATLLTADPPKHTRYRRLVGTRYHRSQKGRRPHTAGESAHWRALATSVSKIWNIAEPAPMDKQRATEVVAK